MNRYSVCTLLALTLTVAGCAGSTGGLGRDSGPVSLPTGIALLGSKETACNGTLHVGENTVATHGPRSEYFVDPGENATFPLARHVVEWTCISQGRRDFDRHACPRRATYVRFTRASNGGGLLLECFG